jgi:hypothetical protein
VADEQPCVGITFNDEVEAPHAGILSLRIRLGRPSVHPEVGRRYRVVHVVANAGQVGLPSWWREYVNSLLD